MSKSLLFASALLFAACASQTPPATDTAAPAPAPVVEAKPAPPPPAPLTVEEMRKTLVDLETTAGTITIEFFPDQAPNHVRNFIELSQSGFYDGVNFHRIIPGFVIQGGDPNTKTGPRSTWGMGGSGKTIDAEFNDIPHERGILSMARTMDPNSATSQFFICVAAAPSLNNQYTVFGRVQSGMEVVDTIVNGKAFQNEQPEEPVVIKRAVVRKQI